MLAHLASKARCLAIHAGHMNMICSNDQILDLNAFRQCHLPTRTGFSHRCRWNDSKLIGMSRSCYALASQAHVVVGSWACRKYGHASCTTRNKKLLGAPGLRSLMVQELSDLPTYNYISKTRRSSTPNRANDCHATWTKQFAYIFITPGKK